VEATGIRPWRKGWQERQALVITASDNESFVTPNDKDFVKPRVLVLPEKGNRCEFRIYETDSASPSSCLPKFDPAEERGSVLNVVMPQPRKQRFHAPCPPYANSRDEAKTNTETNQVTNTETKEETDKRDKNRNRDRDTDADTKHLSRLSHSCGGLAITELKHTILP
jgi:hypothetical protein